MVSSDTKLNADGRSLPLSYRKPKVHRFVSGVSSLALLKKSGEEDWRNRINRKQEAGVTTAAAVMADTSAPLWETEQSLRKVTPLTSDLSPPEAPAPPLRGSLRVYVKEVWGEEQRVFCSWCRGGRSCSAGDVLAGVSEGSGEGVDQAVMSPG